MAASREIFLDRMANLCTLLQDPSYYAAFRTVQDHNLTNGKEKPSKEEYESAMQTLRNIEEENGIECFTKMNE